MVSEALPVWVKKYLQPGDLAAIEDAVRVAEAQTVAEIVPMLVHHSGGVGHVRRIMALLAALLAFVIWEFGHWYGLGLSPWIFFGVACVLGLMVVFTLGSHHDLQRWLTDQDELCLAAERRAIAEFQASRITATKHSTGILLFVSLMEHRCFVLADRGVAERLPADTWDKIVEQLVTHIKSNNMGKGFVEAIKHMTPILAAALPAVPDDQNEVPNALVIKE